MLTRKTTQGVALLEVLVSVALLSLSLLGIAGLLVTTQKATASSYIRQQATQYAYNVIDMMRLNKASVLGSTSVTFPYNLNNAPCAVPTTAPTTDCSIKATGACTPAQQVAYDLYRWQTELGTVPALVNSASNASSQCIISGAPAGPNVFQVTVTLAWCDTLGTTSYQQNLMKPKSSSSSTCAPMQTVTLNSQL